MGNSKDLKSILPVSRRALTFFRLKSALATASGPPCRIISIETDATSSLVIRPPVFSSTHSFRLDARYPKAASFANSVSPAGTSLERGRQIAV